MEQTTKFNADEPFIDPILIRYDGLDAANYQIDLSEFGKSAQGIAKIMATIANFTITQNYKKDQRKLNCRVVIGVPKENCFSIEAIIQCVDSHPFLYNTLGATLGIPSAALITKIFTIITRYFWSLISGSNRTTETEYLRKELSKTIELLGRKEDTPKLMNTIDLMVVSLIPAAQEAVRPIGNTCDTIKFGDKNTYYTELNLSDKEAILNEEFEITEESSHRVLISELDMKKFTCKISLKDELYKRFSARITDPQIELPNNPYAVAMATKGIVTIKAKQKIIQDVIKEFIISNIDSNP